MRLIGPNGEQVGVIATSVALNLAKEANLDLVEVAPNAKPPVAKLIDYGKFKYNEKIKQREARRNQSTAEIKEIRFRLKIDDHDFEVKKGHVVRFLNGGDKVKVTIMLRGREQSRPIGGVEMLQRLAADVEEYLRRGLLNIVGGCCGTTPEHIFELSKIVGRYAPRPLPTPRHETVLSGLEPLRIVPEANFINVGERTNVAGSARFARLIREHNYEEALSVARAQVEAGAQIVDVCMDDGLIDGVEAMRTFLNLMASEPEIRGSR